MCAEDPQGALRLCTWLDDLANMRVFVTLRLWHRVSWVSWRVLYPPLVEMARAGAFFYYLWRNFPWPLLIECQVVCTRPHLSAFNLRHGDTRELTLHAGTITYVMYRLQICTFRCLGSSRWNLLLSLRATLVRWWNPVWYCANALWKSWPASYKFGLECRVVPASQ